MRDKLAIILLIIIGIFFYTLTIKGVPGNIGPLDIRGKLDTATKPFELSPERSRYAETLSLATTKNYDLGKELGEVVYPDVGFINGHYYSLVAPGIAYLAVPFYELGAHFNLSQLGSFAVIPFFAILSFITIFKIARQILKLSISASIFAVLTYGFATTSWSYAISLYQHHVTVFLMLSAFYATWKFKQNSRVSWFWALWVWLAFGLAITIDYPNLILMIPVMSYFFVSALKILREPNKIKISLSPAAVVTVVAFLAIVGLNGVFNHKYFGSWNRLAGEIPNYEPGQTNLPTLQDDETTLAQIAGSKGFVNFFSDTNIPRSFYTLLFSSDRGLFIYSPILILGFLGLWVNRKNSQVEHSILLGIIAVNLLLYSSWGDPWGGWAYGPRYLIPAMACLSLFTAIWIYKVRLVWAKLLTIILFAYSSAIAILGAVTSNAVPPQIQAVNLPLKYSNFLYNWLLLRQNKSGSFIYNEYLSYFSLERFTLILYLILMLIAIVLILPNWKAKNALN